MPKTINICFSFSLHNTTHNEKYNYKLKMANQAVRAFRVRDCHSTKSVPTLLRGSRENFRNASPRANWAMLTVNVLNCMASNKFNVDVYGVTDGANTEMHQHTLRDASNCNLLLYGAYVL